MRLISACFGIKNIQFYTGSVRGGSFNTSNGIIYFGIEVIVIVDQKI